MPAAAARALRPRATRTPLIAMTAVQSLCRMAKTIPDQPKIFRRDDRDTVDAESCGASWGFASAVEFSGTAIEFSGARNSRPIGAMQVRVRLLLDSGESDTHALTGSERFRVGSALMDFPLCS